MVATLFALSRRAEAGALALAVAGCGTVQGADGNRAPDPAHVVPHLLGTHTAYRNMGFMAPGPPLPFVATIRFLAGARPDSTLAILGISLPNSALSFRRAGDVFEASYNVAFAVRRAGSVIRQVSSSQRVRVSGFQETQRSDESVVFQQFVWLPPGAVQAALRVRDRNGSAAASAESDVVVPRFDGRGGFSSLIPIFWGDARSDRSAAPNFLVNPRATAPYGVDTLRFYLESYRAPSGTEIALDVLEKSGTVIWRSRLELTGALPAALAVIPPGELPIGELQLRAVTADLRDTAAAPLLIGFSEEWVVSNFDDVLSLLRHFGHRDAVRGLQQAQPSERPALWRAFWKETDPNPTTPEHEAMVEYFERLDASNKRFEEPGRAGWLTDRGEVFVTLGNPDEVIDQGAGLDAPGRVIRWTYLMDGLVLEFVDEGGFGRYRLTPSSRSDYLRVLNRRRSQ